MTGHDYAIILAFACLSLGLALTTLFYRRLWNRDSRIRTLSQNLSVSLFSILYALLLLEVIAKVGLVQSSGIAPSLSAKKWFSKYWKPINSQGFRDIDHNGKILVSTNRLLVVGDSFVAGHGIKDPQDRFTNILARHLGTGWSVINLGKTGWNTSAELDAVRAFSYRPHVIVLAYTFNDIEGAAGKLGYTYNPFLYFPTSQVRSVIDKSYFLDFLYWRLYWRLTKIPRLSASYYDFLRLCFGTKRIWETHKDEILRFIAFTRQVNAKSIFVVFPMLSDPEGSRKIISPVLSLLHDEKVEVIDLSEKLSGRKISSIVVNSQDYHPNETVHREVGDLIFERLQAWGAP